MPKIYIDTNRYLDYYRGGLGEVDVLEDVIANMGHLVVTRQTINEFRRNRLCLLRSLSAEFKKSIKAAGISKAAILHLLSERKELVKYFDSYSTKAKELLRTLELLGRNEDKDPVAAKLFALWGDPAMLVLETTDDLIDKAHRSKLLGNLPSSPGKYSVGDEVIWEVLMANLKEDLIFVTRDHSFSQVILRDEFAQQKGRSLILVTDRFSAALKAAGATPSQHLIVAEQTIDRKLPSKLEWNWKGSGPHARVLFERVNALVQDYLEQVELETGQEFGNDYDYVPIMRGLAGLIIKDCDDFAADLKEQFGRESEGDEDIEPRPDG